MLKKRVVKRLLPLLFSFCCVFSGFLSVNVFAYTSYDFVPLTTSASFVFINSSGGVIQSGSCDYSSINNLYTLSNTAVSGLIGIDIDCNTTFNIAVDVSNFDYYLVASIYGPAPSISNFTFMCEDFNANANDHNNKAIGLIYGNSKTYYHFDTEDIKGFSVSGKLNFNTYSNISGLAFYTSVAGTVPANLKFEAAILSVPKDTSSENVQSIISAINNQTTTLDSSIGQASDDIQQSIEDQYSGDPETEFSVDDVITQHNEKMGVLSFGSDVMLQFLDMFQSANVGTAQLTLPGFNITVENVEYSVWPDYSFNFEQLNEWVPALMSVIRVMLPAFVWLMVLRYCINVFEKNFLSNGG